MDEHPPRVNRLIAVIIGVACATPLVVAAVLKPSASGMGTHMQMGLPDCGFKALTGYPCATCGCTTAFAHAADGSLLTSFTTQPFGALLAVALAMMTLIAGWSFWTGESLAGVGRVCGSKRFVGAWVVILLGAWAYKAAMVAAAG